MTGPGGRRHDLTVEIPVAQRRGVAPAGPASSRAGNGPVSSLAGSGPVAVFVFALTCAATLTGTTLHVENLGSPSGAGVTDWWLMQTVSGGAFGTTGAWLAWRQPRLAVGWLMLASGALQAVSFATVEYWVWGFARGPGAFGATTALWLAQWTWIIGLFSVALVLPPLLPDGRLVSDRWRPAFALAVLATVAEGLRCALAPASVWAASLPRLGVVNQVAVPVADNRAVVLGTTVAVVAALAAGIASLVVRWRRGDGETRQQLRWLLFGLMTSVPLFAAGFAAGPLATAAAMLPLPVACLVAALRYGLWDLRVVVSRAVVWALLTAVVIGVYVGCVWLLGSLAGGERARLVATVLVAVAALPAHQRLRALVNTRLFGRRDDPYTALARLGDQLEATGDAETVAHQALPELTRMVAAALHRPYVALELQDGAVVRHGEPTDAVETVPLAFAGAPVGQLVVASREGEPSRWERRLLSDLARQAAVAVHAVLLASELRTSREHAVTVREDERRRLHRELHDGMGPTLAAVALQVETARELVPEHDGQAGRLLDRALAQLKHAVAEVREIVAGLRPLSLDDLGLDGAVRELVSGFATPQLAVDLELGELGELPAAVEVAAYRIVAEAVTNAARHAAASQVRVTLRRDGTGLRVSVDDDGAGLRADARPGVGLRSMEQRARELGGTFQAGARDTRGGTRVEALLPAPAPA